jgi:hypothetical protein
MCLFLEVHELDGRDADAFVRARSTQAPQGVRLLKHWLGDDGRNVAFLVEAPNEETLRACAGGAKEITELFAPAERWMGFDAIEIA